MKIDILTLFPNMFEGFLNESIIKRAITNKKVKVTPHNIRDYTLDTHKKVDDTPYGGGAGMVLMCQPIFDAVKELQSKNAKVILMTPQGIKFNQKLAYNLSKEEHLILICGHYEGFDERVRTICDMEISIGDYVLTGGELPSMVVTDAVVRLVDGVIDSESHQKDSFNNNLLDYPNYTKPQEYEGLKVPEVLTSGHHENIENWRKEESIKRTKERRPDLIKKTDKSSYLIIKEKNGNSAFIKQDSMEGYKLNPKNNAKRDDVINVTNMVIMEPKFIEKIVKKNIEKSVQQLLRNVMIIAEEGSESENVNIVLGEAERLKKVVYNYSLKVLSDSYKESIKKKIDFIVKEFKMKKVLAPQVEEKEKEGKSR